MNNKPRDRALINNLNKNLNKKPMNGTVKVVIISLVVMTMGMVLLVIVGNMDFSLEQSQSGYDVNLPTAEFPNFSEVVHGGFVPPMEGLIDHVFYWEEGGTLELPVVGASGWAAASVVKREEPNANARQISTLSPGRGFVILDTAPNWWYVQLDNGETGWVDNRRCFINLPDVLPSIVYNITNATAAVFRSSSFVLPGVTGYRMYNAHSFNYRLGRYEYIVPGKYPLAHALFIVQQSALRNNDTLIIYEVFRPRSTQRAVVASLNRTLLEHEMANEAIANSPWNVGNFISQGVSNHQRGGAVDVALGIVNEIEIVQAGDFSYVRVADHTRIHAGSAMHELSPWSAIVDRPGAPSNAAVLAGNVDWSDAVTPGVERLQRYFAAVGFRPLSSEWWHFDHPPSINQASSAGVGGEFYTETIYSFPPTR
jgi:D-alanyl-D-alanine dipeptidase